MITQERRSRRSRKTPRVEAVARAVAGTLDVDDVVHRGLDVILREWDVDAATVLMVDAQTRAVMPVPSRGMRRADCRPDDGVDPIVLGTLCVERDDVVVERLTLTEPDGRSGFRTHVCLPLRGLDPRARDGDGASTFNVGGLCDPAPPKERRESAVLAVLHAISSPAATASELLSAADIAALGTASEHIGLALQNALAFARSQQRNHVLRGLHEIAELSTRSLKLGETMGVTLTRILEIVRAETGSIYLHHGDGGLSLAAHQGPPGSLISEDPTLAGRGEIGTALQSGQLVVWCPSGSAVDDPCHVYAALPLTSKGQVLGLLRIGCSTRGAFTHEEIEFLNQVGGQLGLAIENGTQFQTISEQAIRLSRRTGHLATLLEMSDLMARAVELEGDVEACVARLGDVVSVQLLLVFLDDGEQHARLVASFVDRRMPRSGRRIARRLRLPWRDLPTADRAMQQQRMVVVDDSTSMLGSFESEWLKSNEVRAALVLPLVVNGVSLGALVLASVGEPRVFFPSELDFARTVANQLALAIERDRLFREVKNAAARLEMRVEARTRELREANVRLHEATRQRSDFLKVMQHELRTPLNAILGFSEVMADVETDVNMDEMREYSGHIHESGRNLLALINDILDLANPQSARENIHVEQVRVEPLVCGILEVIRPQALGRGIVLSNLLDGMPPVLADRARLKQIFYNLFSNAVKFSPSHAEVKVGGRVEKGQAILWVEDAGPGIPPDMQERIFEPFFQIDRSITRAHDGAGLGLSLARRYVRMLGGELWVQSAPDQGSRFEFSLPLAEVVEGESTLGPEAPAPPTVRAADDLGESPVESARPPRAARPRANDEEAVERPVMRRRSDLLDEP